MLVIFLAVLIALVFAFRAVLTPFLIALFAAYLLDPLVARMAPLRVFGRFTLRRGGSIVIIYLILLFAFYLGLSFAVPAAKNQIAQIQKDLPRLQEQAEEKLQLIIEGAKRWLNPDKPGEEDGEGGEEPNGDEGTGPKEPDKDKKGLSRFHLKGGGVIEAVVVKRSEHQVIITFRDGWDVLELDQIEREERLDGEDEPFDAKLYTRKAFAELQRNLGSIAEFTFNFAVGLIKLFAMMALILMLTAFTLIDREPIVNFIKTVPPKHYQRAWQHLMQYLDRGLAGVIRGQLAICAVNGFLTWIGLMFLGVHYAGLLGLIAGIFSLIPIFGTILSTVPIVLIAWSAGTFYQGLLALAWILLIHFIEANFLNPKIMGTASKIHPVVVVFALIAGEHAYGIVGALLAVPAASIVQSCFKFYVIDRAHEKDIPGEDEALAAAGS